MRFSSHQVISAAAIAAGFILLYSGIAGAAVFLYLIGVTIVLVAGLPSRKIEIVAQLRDFKFRFRLIPDEDADASSELEEVSSNRSSGQSADLEEQ